MSEPTEPKKEKASSFFSVERMLQEQLELIKSDSKSLKGKTNAKNFMMKQQRMLKRMLSSPARLAKKAKRAPRNQLKQLEVKEEADLELRFTPAPGTEILLFHLISMMILI